MGLEGLGLWAWGHSWGRVEVGSKLRVKFAVREMGRARIG